MEVTEENKMKYLNLLAQHRLVKSVKEEIEAFLKGNDRLKHTHLYIKVFNILCLHAFISLQV